MDLFEYAKSKTLDQESPLASRLRPTTLDEVVGQQHIIGKNTLLYRAIKADKLTSVIFYGPPGTGKTTLAKVIANTTSAEFTQINATVAGKKDMEAVVKEAQQNLGMYGKKTILFIDEIHRFNKGQQDYLLPFVEDGTIILIGATTENPYFEVNAALISRSIIFELKSLEISEVKELILRAVNDKTKGMGNYKARIDEDALDFLADMAGGDARNALNAIELGILTTPRSEDGLIHITLDVASQCIQKRVVRYDKNGDKQHDMLRCSVQNYLDTLPITYDFHTKYVTATALAMFDQWQKVHKLDPRMRDILAAAARLHDIGNLINYYSHARHSCYMTANAHIFGWTHSEQVMCALICAFHHGYSGKYLKANGQAHILTAAQMRQVRILSLFLAMAEGLDESQ